MPAPANDLVSFICVDRRHVDIGRARPDGSGHISINAGEWAYCTAGLAEEPHDWVGMTPRRLDAIHHADPPGGSAA